MLTRVGSEAPRLRPRPARRGQPGGDAEEDVTATLATEAQPLTHVGTLVGTWPYLAPEQVQGRPADARSDIFALGCVLFEALAGRRAFPGATRAEITAAILGAEPPDLREAVPGVPAALAALVRQCLAKDPDERWQCADDVARGLRLVEEGVARPEPAATARRRRPRAGRSRSARWASPRPPLPRPCCSRAARGPSSPCASRWPPPAGVLLSRPTMGTPFAVSPDGRRIVFSGGSGGQSSLWLWSAEDGQSRRLEDTSGGISPFFSPDGREVAFFAGDDLRRVPVDGGPATTITAAPVASSGSWGSGGTILFTRPVGADAGIYSGPGPRRRAPSRSR